MDEQNGSNSVLDFVVRPAAEDSDAVALIDAPSGRSRSRGDVLSGVRAAAATLAARGVQPEQRVLMCCADTPAFLHWFWGAMWIGAVPVPVSTMLNAEDYTFLLDDSRAVAMVYSPPFTDVVVKATENQRFLRWTLDDTDTDAMADEADCPDVYPATGDDTAFWLYTSGTTGFPKGALHRHIDLTFCTEQYARGVIDMGPDDVVYSVAKLFFAYGLGNAGYFPCSIGACAVLNPARPMPLDVADHVTTHRPTMFFGVPTFYAALLEADLPSDTFTSVRIAVSAGEPLPADIHRRFMAKFGIEILDGIGTTELAHIFLTNLPGQSVPGTSGVAVDGYEVSLRDENGDEVADGEPGALFVAGESVMTGYWNRTDRNRAALMGRFIATGDTYHRNPDGTYTCLGRSDDMLKVGGIWVSPAEVEGCIIEMADVVNVAVVGADDENGLVKPKAFVVPRSDADRTTLEAAVKEHVRSRLAPFKYPRWVEITDELPQTATGKIKRYLLRN